MPFGPTPRSERDQAMLDLLEADEMEKAVIRAFAHEVRRLGAARRIRLRAVERLAGAQVMEDETLEVAA